MNQRLYRSRDERIIAGVAGGLAEQFNVDPSLVRILWVALAVLTAGVAVLFYLVMAFIVPEEPAGDQRWSGWQRRADAYLWPEPGTPAAAGPAEGAAGPSEAVSAGRPAEAASGAAGMPLAGPAATAATAPGPSAPIGTESIWAGAPPTGAAAAGGSPPRPSDAAIGGSWRWGTSEARAARAAARDARHEARMARHEARGSGFGAVIFGLILILAGGYFLVRAYVPSVDVDRAWPILLVVIGLLLLVGSLRRSSGPPA